MPYGVKTQTRFAIQEREAGSAPCLFRPNQTIARVVSD
jgi:hypothetical protein